MVVAARTSWGWSVQENFRDADLIVIGRLSDASAVDLVERVEVQGQLLVRRVLRGDAGAGDRLSLRWSYKPGFHESPQQTTVVAEEHGLWLLRRDDHSYRPLQIGCGPHRFRCTVLSLPDGAQAMAIVPSPDASWQTMLGAELAGALAWLAQKEGDGLNPKRTVSPSGGTSLRATEGQLAFMSISTVLWGMEMEETVDAYDWLSSSPLANVRVIGLAGLLRTGRTDLLSTIEAELETLAPTLDAGQVSSALLRIAPPQGAESIVIIGRLALSDVLFPGLEQNAVSLLSRAKTLDALPYEFVLLGSPSESTRSVALSGICTALRGLARKPNVVPAAWLPDIESRCPKRFPLDPEDEAFVIRFWEDWWRRNRDEVSRVHETLFPGSAPLAENLRAPARYSQVTRERPVERRRLTREQAFLQLLSFSGSAGGGFDSSGNAVLAPLTRRTGLHRSLSAADEAALLKAFDEIQEEFDAHRRKQDAYRHRLRVSGAPPDSGVMEKFADDYHEILRQGAARAPEKLSPEGRDVLEQRLESIISSSYAFSRVDGVRLGAPE